MDEHELRDSMEKSERAIRIRRLLDEVAEIWPGLDVGDCNLNVLYSGGKVRRVYVHFGPIRMDDLGSPLIGSIE